MRQTGQGVRHDLRAVAALVPGCLGHQTFGRTEQDDPGDRGPEPVVTVQRPLVLVRPLLRHALGEVDEALLCTLAGDIRQQREARLGFREVGLGDQLVAGIEAKELLLLRGG